MAMMHTLNTRSGWRAALVAAAVLVAATTTAAVAQHVLVMVNGEPITALDVEQRMKLVQLTTQKPANRQAVIEELIDEKLKVREGRRWGQEVSDSDVDNSFASMGQRMHKSADQLTQDLAKSGINASTLKSRIRAEMVWQQIVRGRYGASLQLSDREIDLAMQSKNVEEKEIAVTEYVLRPILFLVPPGSQGSVLEGRRKEADALRVRFKGCEEGLHNARTLRDVTVRDQVVRNSADLPPELHKLLDAVPVGQLTSPEVTRLGIEMFAVCGKQESKADNPMKKQVRETAFSERFEEQSKRYLKRLRGEAMIDRR
jgi:peptidyl-prolyl cis-trans isomerase SurA